MKIREKEVDAVKTMRDIRDKLHEGYEKNMEKCKAELKRVREKWIVHNLHNLLVCLIQQVYPQILFQ